MLEDAFNEIYTKFKLNFYCGIFERLNERDSSLTATEAFSVEIIYAMGKPTISQFAEFLQISLPNATYKVNTLVRKGYIEKINSKEDKREYFLHATQKFIDYYAINQNYLNIVMQRIRERFSEKETAEFVKMLQIISLELMPESKSNL